MAALKHEDMLPFDHPIQQYFITRTDHDRRVEVRPHTVPTPTSYPSIRLADVQARFQLKPEARPKDGTPVIVPDLPLDRMPYAVTMMNAFRGIYKCIEDDEDFLGKAVIGEEGASIWLKKLRYDTWIMVRHGLIEVTYLRRRETKEDKPEPMRETRTGRPRRSWETKKADPEVLTFNMITMQERRCGTEFQHGLKGGTMIDVEKMGEGRHEGELETEDCHSQSILVEIREHAGPAHPYVTLKTDVGEDGLLWFQSKGVLLLTFKEESLVTMGGIAPSRAPEHKHSIHEFEIISSEDDIMDDSEDDIRDHIKDIKNDIKNIKDDIKRRHQKH